MVLGKLPYMIFTHKNFGNQNHSNNQQVSEIFLGINGWMNNPPL